MTSEPCDGILIGGYPLTGIIRRVRRTVRFSQRELARYAGVSAAALARYESGTLTPSLRTLQRVLHAANYQLVVVDVSGRLVAPLEVFQNVCDLAGRRFPAHLDLIIDPVLGEWWADCFGLARPPETFRRRSDEQRDYERRLSRWEVRVKQFRNAPRPRPPIRPRPTWPPLVPPLMRAGEAP